MIVSECMTRDVELVTPEMKIKDVAKKMRDGDFGIVPVQRNDKLIGMLTDRDIVTRCVADGLDLEKALVEEVMSNKVLYCFEDQEVEIVMKNLGENQIRRLPVVNRDKKLVGIVSLGDLTKDRRLDPDRLKKSMEEIAEPGLYH